MNAELVSVIVPSFNRAYCISRTIASALAQTHARVEVIVIDDGSTDDTEPVVRAFGDDRIRYLRQDNGGVSSARNRGMAAARGEFVAFLDSDDTWLPWKLEVQLACMRSRPDVGMTWTDMQAIDPDGMVFDGHYLRTLYTSYRRWFRDRDVFAEHYPLAALVPHVTAVRGAMFRVGDIYSEMLMGNMVHTSTVVLRRERIEQVGRFDTALMVGEDYEFHLRTCRAGLVGLVDVPAIQFQRGRPDRLTRHSSLFARHYLHVVEREVRQYRQRITLSPTMLRSAVAEGEQWLGEELLLDGRTREGRAALLRSIRLRPFSSRRPVRILASSFLPEPARRVLRRVVSNARGVAS